MIPTDEMATHATDEDIQSRLQTFINDNAFPNTKPFKDYRQQSTILYCKCLEGEPRDHIKFQHIPAVKDGSAKYQKCGVLFSGDLQDHILFQVIAHDSALVRCTLIDCTVYGGKIESSNLQECRVQKKAFGGDDSTPITPMISGCQIENSTFFDADISNSSIPGGLSIKNCKLENIMTVRSLVIGSSLTKCGLDNSELRNCEVTDSVLTASVSETKIAKNNSTLRRFPAEIRAMIFAYFMINKNQWTIFDVLRPDPLLYDEALEVWYKEHRFKLSVRNYRCFAAASKTMAGRMSKLHIEYAPFSPSQHV
jgi:hypothetical protein